MASEATFDFEKEVDRALEMFPELRSNTVFIKLLQSAPKEFHGDKTLINLLSEDFREQHPIRNMPCAGYAVAEFNGERHMLNTLVYARNELLLQLAQNINLPWGPLRTFVFDHELGHIVQRFSQGQHKHKWKNILTHTFKKNNQQDRDSGLFEEYYADAFAAIRHLQRHNGDTSYLNMWSTFIRALRATSSGDTSHITTPVIDRIIEDSKSQDFLSLSPQGIAALAYSYAEKYTPGQKEIDVLKKDYSGIFSKIDIFNPELANDCNLSLLASTALSASTPFSFTIGARAFQPFLHPEGVVIGGVKIQLPEERRQNLLTAFNTRAKELGLVIPSFAAVAAVQTEISNNAQPVTAQKAARLTSKAFPSKDL